MVSLHSHRTKEERKGEGKARGQVVKVAGRRRVGRNRGGPKGQVCSLYILCTYETGKKLNYANPNLKAEFQSVSRYAMVSLKPKP